MNFLRSFSVYFFYISYSIAKTDSATIDKLSSKLIIKLLQEMNHISQSTLAPKNSCINGIGPTNVGWFFHLPLPWADPRKLAYSESEDNYVQHVLLENKKNCSCILIAKDLALTAAHCLENKPTYMLYDHGPNRDGYSYTPGESEKIEIDDYWIPDEFMKDKNGRLHGDLAIIHLSKPILNDKSKFLEFATEDEIKTAISAKSIGYPTEWIGLRLRDDNCSVKNLSSDFILSDCAATVGDSGGPLLIKTKDGQWKIAGITSGATLNKNHEEPHGDFYSDELANRYTNISMYTQKISEIISKSREGKSISK